MEVSTLILISFGSASHATTTLNSSSTTETLSTDTSYVLNAGSSIVVSVGNAITVNGVAPVTLTNSGTITSGGNANNTETGVMFNVAGSLINQSTGLIHGATYGVFFSTGASDNVTNHGDISVSATNAVAYFGSAGGTVDNYGTLNKGTSGAVGTGATSLEINTTGAVTLNNYSGGSVLSGIGDTTYGVAVEVGAGTLTVNNQGLISGYRQALYSMVTGTSIVNSGTIQSNLAAGVQLALGSSLNNSGTISSTSQAAIVLTGANNVITLSTGSKLTGANNAAILSEGSGNSIVLTGTNTDSENYAANSGMGFTGLTANAGSNWTLDGQVTMGGSSAQAVLVNGDLTLGGTITNNGGGVTIGTGGKLTFGTGGTSGMATGNITDNGTLAFNRSDALTFSAPVRGTGGVVQAGTDTLALSGTNTYSGGTTLNSGTLSVASNANLGAAAGGLNFNGGTLLTTAGITSARGGTLAATGTIDNGGNADTFSGVFSGAGGLASVGAGTLILAGNDTYTGGTTVSAGTLQLGNGGTAGNVAGNIVDNAALVFDRSDTPTFGGVISGTGKVTQSGSGTFTLTGTNTYTGGTTVSAGTLQLGNNGTAGSVTGDVTDNASLVFDRSDTPTFAGVISGSGKVTQSGSGTLTLSGTNTYSGSTVMNGGTLSVASDANLGAASGGLTFNGGTLLSSAALNTARAVSLTGAGIINNGGNIDTFSGEFGGTGKLTATGAGTLALSGTNTYSGGTLINGGTLSVASDANLGAATGALAFNGGTLVTSAGITSARAAGLIGSGTINNAGNADTFSGVVSGAGGLTSTGAGTLTLTGNNTYTGNTTISAGTLQLGNGGTSGSVAGAITDNAALVFDRSNALTFAKVISGSGSLTQSGTGVLTLAGASTYTGPTVVAAGTLDVDGSIASATTTVQSGATLGGSGTIGGSVTVASGGHLAPGDAPGTLTINGNLLLNSGSTLDYQLGQAGTTGGALNDLTVVRGNLTLAGTLNVTQSTGGSFGPGLYRIISYGGTLTDSHLAVGAVPGSGPFYVQTAVPGQVNLVDAAGAGPLTFWDGSTPAAFNNGHVDGGNGTWTANTADASWADSTGSINGSWQAGGYAVFEATPGTVTVDAAGGPVTLSGAQFAVNGYTVSGAALNTTTADTVLRVGDGTSAGSTMSATVGSVIAGTGGIEKTDLGTLVLSGNNTYSGGTILTGGTLSVASDANLGAASGGLTFNGGTLLTTAGITSARAAGLTTTGTIDNSGNADTFSGVFSGAGGLTSTGAGTLILTGNNTFAGITTVRAGTLQLGNGGASGSVAGTIADNASLVFDRSDTPTFSKAVSGSGSLTQAGSGTLTLTGNNTYTGGTTVSAGTLVAPNGNVLGTGSVTNNATLQLDFANNGTFANTLTGTGDLNKTGNGVATMTAAGSTQGNVSVNSGTLQFTQNGAFNATGDYTTAAGATTSLSGAASVATGNRFAMNGALAVAAGNPDPTVTAGTATIASSATFDLTGYSAPASASVDQLAYNVYKVIHTTGGLTGTFSTVSLGGSASPVDFLTLTAFYTAQNFDVALGLTWYASHSTTPERANGMFTLVAPSDSFNMDGVLADQPANPATGWDGKTLTKAGDGTLLLSKANTYSGPTLINGGTLRMGTANAITGSSQVAVAAGAVFDLDGFDQQINNLSGAGKVTLGSAVLTESNVANGQFDGVISGGGGFTKAGGGTLILSADNTYTGGTTISAGTLQLGTGGTMGSTAGDMTNNGTVIFDRGDNLVYSHAISGTGDLVQQGGGILTLSNSQSYSGSTTVDAGALLLTNGAQLSNTSQVSVARGATFGGYGGVGGSVTNDGLLAVADAAPGMTGGAAGTFTIGGQLVNNGEVRMASPAPASVLNVAGNYTGNNGQLTLSTVLGDDHSATDRLVVHGNTAGQTAVVIQNAGGAGAQTDNGIQIVQVDGQSNGVFSLDGRVVAGAYEYNLYKGGVTTPNDGDWYLRSVSLTPPAPTPPPTPAPTPSPVPRPETGAYLGNQAAARDMFVLSLHDRIGFADTSASTGANSAPGDGPTVWSRVTGGHTDSEAAGGLVKESTDSAVMQAGIDLLHHGATNQHWQAGIMAGYGSATTDSNSQGNPASARGSVDGINAGVYATWRGNLAGPEGPYVDSWLQYAHFDNTVKGSELSGERYASQVWSGSVEGGWAFLLGHTASGPWLIEPQIQLIYSGLQANDHTESNGTVVHSAESGGLTTRIGARLFHAPGTAASPGWLPFVEVNWWHDTTGNTMAFDNTVIGQDGPKDRADIRIGAEGLVSKQWKVWGHLGLQTGSGGYRNVEGLFGARYTW